MPHNAFLSDVIFYICIRITMKLRFRLPLWVVKTFQKGRQVTLPEPQKYTSL